jgi:hypothetical protein
MPKTLAMLIEAPVPSSAVTPEQPAEAPVAIRRLLLTTLILALCGWVLSLPEFPSQDGGMHLYYTRVIRDMLAHNTAISDFYVLRTPPPPYTLHYILLCCLSAIFPTSMAEKLAVCLILVVSGFGFRFAARSFGSKYESVSFWALPLFLSWPLFMGFHNFCLSTGLCLWCLGLWSRSIKDPTRANCLAFCVFSAAVTLTHPVPLLFLNAFCALDLLRQAFNLRSKSACRLPKMLSALRAPIQLLFWLLFCTIYVRLFVEPHPPLQTFDHQPSFSENAGMFVKLYWLCAETSAPGVLIHRRLLLLAFVVAVSIAGRHFKNRWRNGELHIGDVSLALALLSAIAVPLIPSDFNGLAYFTQRMQLLIFLLLFLAAAATPIRITRLRRFSVIGAVIFSGLIVWCIDRDVRPVAVMLAQANSAQAEIGSTALVFPAQHHRDFPVNFDVASQPWYIGHYLARTNILLVNDPFTDSPNILPLRHRGGPLLAGYTPSDRALTKSLYNHLLHSTSFREAALAKIDLIIFTGSPQPASQPQDPLIAADTTRSWTCDAHPLFTVCASSRRNSPETLMAKNQPAQSTAHR